jgi:hypothetical protein
MTVGPVDARDDATDFVVQSGRRRSKDASDVNQNLNYPRIHVAAWTI